MEHGENPIGGKAVSVIVLIAVLAVGILAYNSFCEECLFPLPEFGGGETGESVIIGIAQPSAQQDFGWLIIPILIPILGFGGWYGWQRWRRTHPPAPTPPPGVPPLPLPITDSTQTQVAPRNWADAIDKLAKSHANAALIEGRAAITIFLQAVKHQQHKPTPLESFGGLFGNFHPKTKQAVIPFAIPLPVFFANHSSADPDWRLFNDVAALAAAEFVYGNASAAAALIDLFKTKFAGYKAGHPPNELIADLIPKGLFDPIAKKYLKKVARYLEGFQKGEIKPVGWYHSHPMNPGYPKNLLMTPSGLPGQLEYPAGDGACQCLFQHKWSGNNPVSALVATEVLSDDEAINFGGVPIGFKFWKAHGCTAAYAASGGTEDVPYKIFCMDENAFNWYKEHASGLIKKGIVLAWYETYYKEYVKPEKENEVRERQKIEEEVKEKGSRTLQKEKSGKREK